MPITDSSATAVGESFIGAIVGQDFDALEALFEPTLRFRAITPTSVRGASTSAGARSLIEGWFGDADRQDVIGRQVEMVADVLHLGYRILQREKGRRYLVEQHVFGSLGETGLSDISLLCSGFSPVEGGPGPTIEPTQHVDARLDALGKSCATLTPHIRDAVRDLEPGQVLEIVTDDPTAGPSLQAWTRLTGNELLEDVAPGDPPTHFRIRRGSVTGATR
jgi:tRNA 2-thiouridine synthesizing protein A